MVSRIGYQLALQMAGIAGLIAGLIWLLIDSSRRIDSGALPTNFHS
jgi:hypothetical protein